MASSFGKMPEPALGRAKPDPADIGAPLDLAAQPLDRVRVELGAMLLREGHAGQHFGPGVAEYGGDDGPPMGAGGLGPPCRSRLHPVEDRDVHVNVTSERTL
ncbi:hypothetical protein Sa4125_11710 [Aureimonas sp. SA4125]|nr:hypothetical protein Sa4125_11710 [Aureimonas sp. SA4125]